MKYDIGDKIKLREDLETDKYYGGVRLAGSTQKHKGEVHRIIDIRNFIPVEGVNAYQLEGMEEHHITDEMIRHVSSKVKRI